MDPGLAGFAIFKANIQVETFYEKTFFCLESIYLGVNKAGCYGEEER
jgi:hypothetical protein